MLTSALSLHRSRQHQQDVYTPIPDNHVWTHNTVTSEQSYKEYRDGKRARLSMRYPLVNKQPGEHNIVVHETGSHSKSLSHGATVLKEVAEGTTLGPQLSVYHHMKSHHALFWTPDIGPLTATSDDDMAKIVDLAVREASTSDAAQLHKNGTPSCFHSVYRADIRLNGAFTGACEKTIKHEHQLIRNLSFTVTDGGAYALQWLVTSHKWTKGNHSRDKDFAPELSWSNFPTQPQSHPCTAEEVLNPPAHLSLIHI